MNDDEIIQAVQGGDQAALGVLYNRYFPSVWRYVCARLGRNQQDVEDVVSETFVAAIRGIDRFDPQRGAVYSWLVGIAKNKRNDFLRRQQREAIAGSRLPVEESSPPDIERIRQVLLELDDDERLALEWKYLEGRAVREIAQRLGRTEKAIEALLYRARGRCRDGDARMQSQE